MGNRLSEIRIKDNNKKQFKKEMKNCYIDEIDALKEYINNVKSYVSPRNKPVYNIDNAFTPEFIDFFCKQYGISYYAYDIMHITRCM